MPDQIGLYRVEREIGRGGMGVVYLARDTKLDRDVAIKVLPESMTRDKERVLRFEREAKTLALLNHPNIGAIYGFEESDGKRFLVLEYVEGQTLSKRLKHGPLQIDDALEIANQIAEALESAHEKGIIHRDLKPANVQIRPDGTVKVLDFGLARAVHDDSSGESRSASSPTITADFTRPGVVLGTAAYMSPEQARGRPLDKRTDIWSFGVLFYECLTGQMLFGGETATDSMGAIMHREPDWSSLPPETPPTVQLLLRRCLARDRNHRLHDIGDARIEITYAIADPLSSSLGLAAAVIAEPAKKRSRRRLLTALALFAVAIVAASAMWFATAPLRRPPPRTMQLVIPSQTDKYTNASDMVVSPDGTSVAFVAARRAGAGIERRLWVRRLGEFDARELGTETNEGLFWSHDSRYIAFHTADKLWSIRADGADKRPLASVVWNNGATWNADGDILIAQAERGLQILRAGVASLEPLTTLSAERFETAHAHPHFLPDGNRYLYLALTFDPEQKIRMRTLYAGNLATGEQTMIARFSSNAWYVEPGQLVYVEDGTVKSVPFDAKQLRITGEPRILAQDANYFRPTGKADISVSRTGVVVFEPRSAEQLLVLFDAEGNRLGEVGTPVTYDFSGHRISPDGRTVAVAVADPRTKLADIMLLNLHDDASRRLTFGAHWEGQPVWSRDGKTMYFSTDQHGWPDVYSLDVSGGGAPREVFSESDAWFPTDVSPDGRFLTVVGVTKNTASGVDIWVLPLVGDGEPLAYNSKRGVQRGARFSPDGKWLAYSSTETGDSEIFMDTFPEPSGAVQVSTHGGFSPVWSPDGKRLYFGRRLTDEREWAMMSVELSDSNPLAPLPPVVLFKPGRFNIFDLAPDGERFLVRIVPDESPDNHVILNWQGALSGDASR